jgi:two-component system phosphate regulon sensor histidine kinase PhoR
MKGNKTALILMVVSMVLLTAFQGFWLRKEYLEQKSNLYKESDLLFKQTVRTLEDSAVKQKVDQAMKMSDRADLKKGKVSKSSKKNTLILTNRMDHKVMFRDSLPPRAMVMIRNDSASIPGMRVRGFTRGTTALNIPPDSIKSIIVHKRPDSSKNFSFVISMTMSSPGNRPDTLANLARIVKPFQDAVWAKKLGSLDEGQKQTKEDRMIYLNLAFDSLKTDTVYRAFRKQLTKSGKALKFTVSRDSVIRPDSLLAKKMLLSSAQPGGSNFVAEFPEYRKYIFSKITTQILFSVFLLALTGLAFGFIYRSLQQQNRLNAIKNDLISNVTHELKTPLATVSVALEALQNFGGSANPELSREYLEISRNELDRLSLMVDNILKSSVLEQQSVELALEQLDFAAVTEQVYQVWKPRFESEKAEILLEIAGKNFTVAADRTHMTNVLNNLIDNALKYGGASPVVKLQLSENAEQVSISISDNGIGIPKEYRSQVFEKFFRVPTGDRHNVKGYGLGLNYVKNIVRLHGGQVQLESTVDAGSRFTVMLKK